jgi:hypothetical protein
MGTGTKDKAEAPRPDFDSNTSPGIFVQPWHAVLTAGLTAPVFLRLAPTGRQVLTPDTE